MSAGELAELYGYGPAAYIAVFVFGTLWGSFANVCIYRLPPTDEHPNGRSVVSPGSHCSVCGKPVRWYDNTPLLSYLLLRGQCRDCGAKFSPRYLLVEFATGLLFAAVYHHTVASAFPDEVIELRLLRFAILAAFVTVLVVIAFIDLDTHFILDRVTYPSIPVFYLLGLIVPGAVWWHGLVGAACGYGVVWLIHGGWYLLTRRSGLGLGDGKLLAMVGALLGWHAVVVALFGGAVIGVVVLLPLIGLGRLRGGGSAGESAEDGEAPRSWLRIEVGFGPFLAAAAIVYVFVQPWLEVSLGLALWD